MSEMRTLGEFIVAKQNDFPHASGDLSSLLSSIRLAAKIVNREINKAGLVDITGAVGTDNVQGEEQQKLDLYANDKFKAALEARDQVCGVASEEEDEAVAFNKELNKNAKYVVLMDPLDGSSNIDVNVSVGTIFLYLPSSITDWHSTNRRRFPTTWTQASSRGLRDLRFFNHACLHDRRWRKWLHLRPIIGYFLFVS